jgi:hypothetical protein
MRAALILVAAVPLGLAAGYVWSGPSAPPKRAAQLAVPPVVDPGEVDAPETPADKAWDARSGEQGRPSLQAPSNSTVAEQSVYYRSCREAWAAGAAPIHAGEPGYRTGLDGDSDGIACEPYHG